MGKYLKLKKKNIFTDDTPVLYLNSTTIPYTFIIYP